MENCVLIISHRLLLFNPHNDSKLAIFHFTGDKVEAVKHLMCRIHKDKGIALLNGSIEHWVLNPRTILPPTYSRFHIQFC